MLADHALCTRVRQPVVVVRHSCAGGDEDLRPLAAQVNSEVRKQYILGFSPSGRGELKYRVVFVSVTKKGNWIVRTRRGYRGTAPETSASVNVQRKEGS